MLASLALFMTGGCATNKAATQIQPKPYPFDYCAVIKKPFDKREGAKHRRVYDGYEVLFCCTPCVKAFDINPEPFMSPLREHYRSE